MDYKWWSGNFLIQVIMVHYRHPFTRWWCPAKLVHPPSSHPLFLEDCTWQEGRDRELEDSFCFPLCTVQQWYSDMRVWKICAAAPRQSNHEENFPLELPAGSSWIVTSCNALHVLATSSQFRCYCILASSDSTSSTSRLYLEPKVRST